MLYVYILYYVYTFCGQVVGRNPYIYIYICIYIYCTLSLSLSLSLFFSLSLPLYLSLQLRTQYLLYRSPHPLSSPSSFSSSFFPHTY